MLGSDLHNLQVESCSHVHHVVGGAQELQGKRDHAGVTHTQGDLSDVLVLFMSEFDLSRGIDTFWKFQRLSLAVMTR